MILNDFAQPATGLPAPIDVESAKELRRTAFRLRKIESKYIDILTYSNRVFIVLIEVVKINPVSLEEELRACLRVKMINSLY